MRYLLLLLLLAPCVLQAQTTTIPPGHYSFFQPMPSGRYITFKVEGDTIILDLLAYKGVIRWLKVGERLYKVSHPDPILIEKSRIQLKIEELEHENGIVPVEPNDDYYFNPGGVTPGGGYPVDRQVYPRDSISYKRKSTHKKN